MHDRYLFLLSILVIPFLISEAYATHYTDLGLDDAFYWREHDNDPINSVNATFYGIMESPFATDKISFWMDDGTCDDGDDTCTGSLFIMKVLPVDLLENGTSTTFNWRVTNDCDQTVCPYVSIAVMDGVWTYSSQADMSLGGLPDDAGLGIETQSSCTLGLAVNDGLWSDYVPSSHHICIVEENTTPIASDVLGTGSMARAGSSAIFILTNEPDNTKGLITVSQTITNAEWQHSSSDFVTLMLVIFDAGAAKTQWIVSPDRLEITNTDEGTLLWDFPRTDIEADNWELYNGDGVYELNGTENDYGYFFSYDPDVPDPPTNLIAVTDVSDIDLDWNAPIFEGYNPVIGYKIERESPIGGGFLTLVANTGNTNTFYEDTTVSAGVEYNYRVRALNSAGESLPSNESKDGTPGISEGDPTTTVSCNELSPTIFQLIVAAVTQTTASLCWNGDILPQTDLIGYNVNSTTPWGDPLTIVQNNTGTNATTALIQNLNPGTQYSFRVIGWQNGTGQSNNQTNIANTTTLDQAFDLDDFEDELIGTGVNPDVFDWEFEREGGCVLNEACPNGTSTFLLVNYPDTFNATCTFELKFARSNQTFSNLSTTPIGTDRVYANFTFLDMDREVIDVTCIDENSDSTGRYLMTQSNFPLLEQIDQFRDGTFGTEGQFGVFDFTTLAIIILSMIGFNRVNSAVGAIFSMVIIGVTAYFGIISIGGAIIGGFTILAMGLAIFMHNRNDVTN